MRGDWSDTGPNARPEAEGREDSVAGDAGGDGEGEATEGEAAAREGGEGELQQEPRPEQQPPQDLQESPKLNVDLRRIIIGLNGITLNTSKTLFHFYRKHQ